MIKIYELPRFKYISFDYQMTIEYKSERIFYNYLGKGNSQRYKTKLIQLLDTLKKRKEIVHNINSKYSMDYRNKIKQLVK